MKKTSGGKKSGTMKNGSAISKDVRKSGAPFGTASGQRGTGSKKGC